MSLNCQDNQQRMKQFFYSKLKGIHVLLNQLHQKFDGHPFEEETHCIDSLNNMYPGMVNERCSPLFILANACLALIIGYVVQ